MVESTSAEYSVFEKIKSDPIIGPKIMLMPLKDWAKFILKPDFSFGPRTVTYKFAAVSRNARPDAMVKRHIRKNTYALILAAG